MVFGPDGYSSFDVWKSAFRPFDWRPTPIVGMEILILMPQDFGYSTVVDVSIRLTSGSSTVASDIPPLDTKYCWSFVSNHESEAISGVVHSHPISVCLTVGFSS